MLNALLKVFNSFYVFLIKGVVLIQLVILRFCLYVLNVNSTNFFSVLSLALLLTYYELFVDLQKLHLVVHRINVVLLRGLREVLVRQQVWVLVLLNG